MSNTHLEIIRLYQQPFTEPKQTIGKIYVCQDNSIIYECYCLELPWLNNQRSISCIPAGTYAGKKRKGADSPSRNYDHIHVTNVPNRSWILIHAGTYYTHTLGCILTGTGLKDVNNDTICDVIGSHNALRELMRLLPQSFSITISDRF